MVGRQRLAGAFSIQVDRVCPDPTQPRRELDSEAHRQLTDSVCRYGIMQPIAIRYLADEDVYQIISGERRYRAALAAGLAEVPCWIQTPREEEILVRQVVENWQRSDLNPFELADALARIRDMQGVSQEALAKLTGKPKSEISRLLALLTIGPEAQGLARNSPDLGKRQLYAIARAEPETQTTLIRQIQEQSLTASETEALAKKTQRTPSGSRQRGAPTTHRRFRTSQASVLVTFRKRHVENADILAALDEVQNQLNGEASPPN
jgi:ParB family chromosome partitioning protein